LCRIDSCSTTAPAICSRPWSSRYIIEGQPVRLALALQVFRLELSPASIRNVMADLEDMGLILSPHTSAGRHPHAARLSAVCRYPADGQGRSTRKSCMNWKASCIPMIRRSWSLRIAPVVRTHHVRRRRGHAAAGPTTFKHVDSCNCRRSGCLLIIVTPKAMFRTASSLPTGRTRRPQARAGRQLFEPNLTPDRTSDRVRRKKLALGIAPIARGHFAIDDRIVETGGDAFKPSRDDRRAGWGSKICCTSMTCLPLDGLA